MRSVRILNCDVLDGLGSLDDGSVQTCVTSPPYWGLRDYGVEGQIGLEATVEGYVAKMVTVFREVRRVLADDGTAWVNLGDSYVTSPNSGHGWDKSGLTKANGRERKVQVGQRASMRKGRQFSGLSLKNLVGMPWRVALALQNDGWSLRSDIIWSKPNAMPESATDRPTSAHEYVFLLAKGPRYYYDAEAIAEPRATSNGAPIGGWATTGSHRAMDHARDKGDARTFRGGQYTRGNKFQNGDGSDRDSSGNGPAQSKTRNARSVWTIATQPFPDSHFATFPIELASRCIQAGSREGDTVLDPFLGAGTTALAATFLGRDCVGCELNPEYAEMAKRRIDREAGIIASTSVEVLESKEIAP